MPIIVLSLLSSVYNWPLVVPSAVAIADDTDDSGISLAGRWLMLPTTKTRDDGDDDKAVNSGFNSKHIIWLAKVKIEIITEYFIKFNNILRFLKILFINFCSSCFF